MIEYFFSAGSVVSSNPYVGPLPRINISFFLLSTYTEEFISTRKIITFLPNPIAIEKVQGLSYSIPYPEICTNQYQHILLI